MHVSIENKRCRAFNEMVLKKTEGKNIKTLFRNGSVSELVCRMVVFHLWFCWSGHCKDGVEKNLVEKKIDICYFFFFD